MLINWYRAKKAEYKVKAMFYGVILGVIENQEPLIAMVKTLFAELKDVPADELKDEFMSKVAEVVHNNNMNDVE